ncbi:MAG: type II toxin-antitoxin system Phd/YefM family antitoxin [Gaiellaceae bacterium]
MRRRTRAGEEVLVTDRGKPAARLGPVEGERKLDRVIREAIVEPAPRPWRGPPPKPIRGAGGLSNLALGDRR